MKTPDDIKKGVLCCAGVGQCNECPYDDVWHPLCIIKKSKDAFAYIRQFEADNAQLNRCIENMTDKLNAANDEIAQLQAERDAAVACIPRECGYCKHDGTADFDIDSVCDYCLNGNTRWEWRGVQKEE